MRGLITIAALTITLSGCMTEPTDTGDEVEQESVDPYHVDESFNLLSENMDETWSWTMSDDMSGVVAIEQMAQPASSTSNPAVCFRIEWPEGHQEGGGPNCAQGSAGNLALAVSPAQQTGDETIYRATLHPNDFSLHVWSPSTEAVEIRVLIDTYVANDSE